MENKKIITLLMIVGGLIILVSAIILIVIVIVKKPVSNLNVQQQKESDVKSVVEVCDYKDDQQAYRSSVDNKSMESCACIKDEYLNVACLDVVGDLMLYEEALRQVNSVLCDNIKDEGRKNACMEVVQSKVDYLQTKDPQALADMQAFSHNENAISTLEKLIEVDDKNIDNLIKLALVYAEKGLNEQGQGRDQGVYVQKALDLVERAKKIDKNNSNVYRVEGYVYEVKPDIIGAIQSYNKAIELNKNNVEAYAGRGHANRILGVLDKAIDDFNEAAKLNKESNNIFIYTNLCTLYKSKGDTGEALKKCKIVINSNDVDPILKSEAYQVLGNIYTEMKEYKLAKSQLFQARILTPNSANLYIELSKLDIYQGQYKLAEQNARKAQELTPQKAYASLALAHALYMQEKYEEAIKIAEEGVKLVDGDVSLLMFNKSSTKKDLYYSIANCYRELGDIQNQKKYELIAEETK